MADPVVTLTNGVPTAGSGVITTLGQTLLDGANATHGITTGAAVITDAAGTFQQYLRGIVKLLAGTLTVASHAVTNAGTFAVQVSSTVSTAVTNAGTFAVQAAATAADGSNVTLGAKADAKAATSDATPISAISIWKQISFSLQAFVTTFGAAWTRGAGATDANTQRMALASDSAGVLPGVTSDQASNYNAPALRTVPQEVHIGEVGGKSVLFPVTLSASTGAQAVGTLIADTQAMSSFFRKADGTGWLNSIQVIDQDDQKQAIDFYVLIANVSLGTEGSAVTITDANAVNLLGPFSVAAAAYKDLGGVSVANVTGLGQAIKAVSATSDLYIAAVCASGAPTYTASGIKLLVGAGLD